MIRNPLINCTNVMSDLLSNQILSDFLSKTNRNRTIDVVTVILIVVKASNAISKM